jgi:DNA-binding response OmpR family regulator
MSVVTNPWLLIVEDERDIREALTSLLSIEGYDVRAVEDLRGARDAMISSVPRWLVLDLMLGCDSGETLLAELADRPDAPPTVLLSASPRAREIAHRYHVQMVPKPFDLDVLIDVVRDLGPSHRPSAATL